MRVVQERHHTNPYRPSRGSSSRGPYPNRPEGERGEREVPERSRGYRSPNLEGPHDVRASVASPSRYPRTRADSAGRAPQSQRTRSRVPAPYERSADAWSGTRQRREPTPAERLQAQHERDFHQVRTARRSQVSAEEGRPQRDAAVLREQHAHRIRTGHDGASSTVTGGVSHGGDRLGRARGIEGLDRSSLGSFTIGPNGIARPGRAHRAPQAPHMNDHMTWRSTDRAPRRPPTCLARLALLALGVIVILAAVIGIVRGCAAHESSDATGAPTAESSADQGGSAAEGATWRHTADPLSNSTDFNWSNLGKDANGRKAYLVDGRVISEFGVDVSDNMGVVDWDAAKTDGVQFAFLRAGYRGTAQGELNADDLFQRNVANATAAGIPCGAYFYSQARTEDEAREEASFMLQQIDGKQLDLPIVYDLEVSDSQAGSRVSDLSSAQVSANARAFCQVISDAGYQPMIYGNVEDLSHIDMVAAGQPPIWFADYNGTPSTNQQLAVWQYASKAKIAGFSHPVDANLLFRL